VFAALTKTLKAPNAAHEPCTALNGARNEKYEKRVDEFFDADFLSPLLAALLFPDFIQHFLPFPIPPFDRARALEASIEKTWAQIAPEDPGLFSGDVFTLWNPEGSTPALVLNTTNVETGINHAVMPFMRMDDARVPLFDVLRAENESEEAPDRREEPHDSGTRHRETIALSTAAVLSARFPWVLPAGSYDALSFVDGGYYDNSGLSSAEDIIAILRPRFENVDFVMIGAPEKPLPVAAFALIAGRRSLSGSPIGGIAETQEMLDFCGEHNITADVEVIPIQKINEAYEGLLKSDVKYRFAIDMASLKSG
jgi:hypothetical protein